MEPSYRRPIILGFALSFIVLLAEVVIETANVSLIINRLGPGYTGHMQFMRALSVIIVSTLLHSFHGKISKKNVLALFFGLITGLAAGATLLFQWSIAASLFISLIAQGSLLVGFNFLLWPLLDEIFPPLTRKHIYPVISAGSALSGVIAGVGVSALLRWVEITQLYIIFIGLLLLCGVLAVLFNSAPVSKENLEFQTKTQNTFSITRGSPFLISLLLFNVSIWMIMRLTGFRFHALLLQEVHNEKNFAIFLGYYFSAINLLILFYQSFFAKRFLIHIGPNRILAVFPALILIGSLVTHFHDTTVLSVICHALAEIMVYTIAFGTLGMMFSVMSRNNRTKVQATIESLGASVGTFLVATSLIILTLMISVPTLLYWTIGATTVAAFLSLYLSRKVAKEYTELALQNLGSTDRALFVDSLVALQEKSNPRAVQKLLAVAQDYTASSDPEISNAALRTLAQMKHPSAVPLFLRRLENRDFTNLLFTINMLSDYYADEISAHKILRHKTLVTLEALCIEVGKGDDSLQIIHEAAMKLYFCLADAEKLAIFLDRAFSSNHNVLIANSIEALTYSKQKYTSLYVEQFLSHPNNRVCTTAIANLWPEETRRPGLRKQLLQYLNSENTAEVASALWAIGRIKDPSLLGMLHGFTSKIEAATKLPMLFALLNFSRKSLKKHLSMSNQVQDAIYDMAVQGMTDSARPEVVARYVHLLSGIDHSHHAELERRISLVEVDRIQILYHNLILQDHRANPLIERITPLVLKAA